MRCPTSWVDVIGGDFLCLSSEELSAGAMSFWRRRVECPGCETVWCGRNYELAVGEWSALSDGVFVLGSVIGLSMCRSWMDIRCVSQLYTKTGVVWFVWRSVPLTDRCIVECSWLNWKQQLIDLSSLRGGLSWFHSVIFLHANRNAWNICVCDQKRCNVLWYFRSCILVWSNTRQSFGR